MHAGQRMLTGRVIVRILKATLEKILHGTLQHHPSHAHPNTHSCGVFFLREPQIVKPNPSCLTADLQLVRFLHPGIEHVCSEV